MFYSVLNIVAEMLYFICNINLFYLYFPYFLIFCALEHVCVFYLYLFSQGVSADKNVLFFVDGRNGFLAFL